MCARLLTVAGVIAFAAQANATSLFIVNQPWLRPAGRADATYAYMVLRSSEGATLTGVRAEIATRVAIETADPDHRGKFREIARLALPAGATVQLAPGTTRIRLESIKHALKLGDHVALTLTIENPDGTVQEIPVTPEVRLRSAVEDEMHEHAHAHSHAQGQGD